MIIENIEIVTIIVVLLFGVPVLIISSRQKLLKSFSLSKMTKTFNQSLLIQSIIGLTIGVGAFIINKLLYYGDGKGNMITDVIVGAAYTFIVIGTFIYLPALILLNIINFLIRLIIRKT